MRWRMLFGWLLFAVIAAPFVAYAYPPAIGASEAFIVQSGSMQPAIQTGAVLFVKPADPAELKTGDIITFGRANVAPEDQVFTTHRIIATRDGEETLLFKTKGDANDDPDQGWVTAEQIVGQSMVSLPVMGYVVAYAGTMYGGALLIIVPAMLLIVGELRRMRRTLRKQY